ncbi:MULTISPECIES: DNA replication/repair protein RecF [unclassified Mucilaginibacter]|uniref:DNA replication/repair protein RecF n=1 Tax=unclassified Mucilaginibacter TaxID=2617802 RepID=UPI002AC8D01C|nr:MULTISPECIES: DNA replication/repair protein RecF [unclassified Mucilaginibacter]MEB0262241.1 DNA replication/repair protein RecF [Mucilaginibacter sp. 10I4]MEB0278644.1 DNA replication/repair protein RecF [Mucilaginibacter sp. 10B2]MEB0299354.1 DNA replication/repair protein RecF [Mucilaginibacter sp. 5C4]WPX23402.1 DNA replication/repair protein RecF [Mucilaginibacter sp. 5C4]
MYLQQLSFINFKNYTEAEISLSEGVNVFVGNNGAGKTNLLDAVHYLSLCKSYFNPIDTQQIKQGADFFMINGVFQKNGNKEVVACGVKRNQKKQFKRNKKDYQRLADHIGLLPLVMISPYDISIIIEGSEERRKFIDNVISQTDHNYLDELIVYNKVLANRNALLKQIADTGRYDPELLSVFDEQLIASGKRIFEKRKAFMEAFTGIFNRHYQFISEDAEQVELNYESQLLNDDFAALLKKSMERDRILERTTMGIHKDDLQFNIHGMPMKKFGSQGQQKSFLIALKLAQYTFLTQKNGFKPLLLLDDIFDKLDDNRVTKLMQMVSNNDFGQVFITDTSSARVEGIFEKINVEVKLFKVTEGNVNA